MFIFVKQRTLQDSGYLSGKCHKSFWPVFRGNSCREDSRERKISGTKEVFRFHDQTLF